MGGCCGNPPNTCGRYTTPLASLPRKAILFTSRSWNLEWFFHKVLFTPFARADFPLLTRIPDEGGGEKSGSIQEHQSQFSSLPISGHFCGIARFECMRQNTEQKMHSWNETACKENLRCVLEKWYTAEREKRRQRRALHSWVREVEQVVSIG